MTPAATVVRERPKRPGPGDLPGRWSSRLVHFLLPPACAGCGGTLRSRVEREGEAARICLDCRARLRVPAHPRCARCHAPRGTGLPEDRVCAECHDWPSVLVAARSAVVLAPPADRLVRALKYGGWSRLARDLSDRMVKEATRSLDLVDGVGIVPVPTTPGRLRRRGYNQARLLAEGVARGVRGRLVDALLREGEGESQVSLEPSERKTNVRGAFSLREGARPLIRGCDLVLVDDVLTTGATASAAATALRDGGAATVRLLTFARSLAEEG